MLVISTFELFKIGIGPSSSHTVGPMVAANLFALALKQQGQLSKVERVLVELFGSLGLTGDGHGSPGAIILGLLGEQPEQVCVEQIPLILASIRSNKQLTLMGEQPLYFDQQRDLLLHKNQRLPFHPNAMKFSAFDQHNKLIYSSNYYSVGGGFVVDEKSVLEPKQNKTELNLAFPFSSADQLLELCAANHLSISELMLCNETSWRSELAVKRKLMQLWQVMQASVRRGCTQQGVLPGGLKVKRRAPELYQKSKRGGDDTLALLDKISLYALAVNEENAAGGRLVTAPTNGAAGIIPALLHYYRWHCPGANDEGVQRFLLTAAAIGVLYKKNASISGADVGCQGEIGSACSMAAAGLTEVLGGTPEQVENAAEIAMEHNLGLTCDPVGGLVQIPCIERNAIAATKAISAARMALNGDGQHRVSLDEVIKTMLLTGRDMKHEYKETSKAGLAVAVRFIEC